MSVDFGAFFVPWVHPVGSNATSLEYRFLKTFESLAISFLAGQRRTDRLFQIKKKKREEEAKRGEERLDEPFGWRKRKGTT